MKITYEPIPQDSEISLTKNELYQLLVKLESLYQEKPEKVINIEQL